MMETNVALPDAAVLIETARQARRAVKDIPQDRDKAAEMRHQAASKALDRWAPAIDEVADTATAAAFLGIRPDTLRRRRHRTRADGSSDWPKPDIELGHSPGWSYRTIVLHQVTAFGRGQHGSSVARIPEDAVVYLSIADIAEHFGVVANTAHKWRARNGAPEPDVIVGAKHPQAGWAEGRLAEWDQWHASLDDSAGGPG